MLFASLELIISIIHKVTGAWCLQRVKDLIFHKFGCAYSLLFEAVKSVGEGERVGGLTSMREPTSMLMPVGTDEARRELSVPKMVYVGRLFGLNGFAPCHC